VPLPHQAGHLGGAEGADELEPPLPEGGDVGPGDHAPVQAEHRPADPQPLGGARDRLLEGLVVEDPARVHLARHRAPLGRADEPVGDLELPGPPVARVPQGGQGTRPALHPGGGEVVEHEPPGAQVPAGQGALDPVLAGDEPVHGPVELLGPGPLDPELLAQRGERELAGGRELGARGEEALADHGHHQVALPTGRAQGALEPRGPERAQDDRRRPVGQRALDPQALGGRQVALPSQGPAHQLHHLAGQVREVAQRLVLDLAGLAVASPEQMGDVLAVLVAPPDGGYVDRAASPSHALSYGLRPSPVNDFTGYILQPRRGPIPHGWRDRAPMTSRTSA
jgi:hypothetical protein